MEKRVTCLEETTESVDIEKLDLISKRCGWFDLPRDGGGDIDLADFPLDYQLNKKLDYQNFP